MGAGVVRRAPSATRSPRHEWRPRSSRRRSTTPWRRRLRLCAPTCPLSRFRQRGPRWPSRRRRPLAACSRCRCRCGHWTRQRRSASARGNLVGRRPSTKPRRLPPLSRAPCSYDSDIDLTRPLLPRADAAFLPPPPAAPTFAGGPRRYFESPCYPAPLLEPSRVAVVVSVPRRSNGVVEQSPSIQIAPAAYAPRAPSAPELPVVVGNFLPRAVEQNATHWLVILAAVVFGATVVGLVMQPRDGSLVVTVSGRAVAPCRACPSAWMETSVGAASPCEVKDLVPARTSLPLHHGSLREREPRVPDQVGRARGPARRPGQGFDGRRVRPECERSVNVQVERSGEAVAAPIAADALPRVTANAPPRVTANAPPRVTANALLESRRTRSLALPLRHTL